MTPTDKPAKTPAQAEKEAAQKAWEDNVKVLLDAITEQISSIDPEDTETRAYNYRALNSIKDKVAQCSPEVRAAYNRAIEALFGNMDAIPSRMFLSEEDPKP